MRHGYGIYKSSHGGFQYGQRLQGKLDGYAYRKYKDDTIYDG
jgi:hypothetical protein